MSWGFHAHKIANQYAVFTLPEQLIGFYKKNIDYLTEHSVDADKRRYAIKEEAPRHYIDIDYYGEDPFGIMPIACHKLFSFLCVPESSPREINV